MTHDLCRIVTARFNEFTLLYEIEIERGDELIRLKFTDEPMPIAAMTQQLRELAAALEQD